MEELSNVVNVKEPNVESELNNIFSKDLSRKITNFSNYGFTFIGNESCNLVTFTEKSFFIKLYWGDTFLEYNFDGELLREWTEEEFNLAISDAKYRSLWGSYKLFEWVLPSTVSSECYNKVTSREKLNSYANYKDFKNIFSKFNFGKADDDDDSYDGWKCGDFKVERFLDCLDGYRVMFIVSDHTESIISIASIEGCNYWDGDSGTTLFILDGKNILINNMGDCPSVLLLKNNTKYGVNYKR